MPIGSRLAGIATGPSVGPRFVDPRTTGPADWSQPGAGAGATVVTIRLERGRILGTGQLNVPSSPQTLIEGESPNRRTITVANQGTTDVYLGGPTVSITSGYRLAVGQALVLETTAAVYAVVPTGAAGLVHFLAEYDG